MDRSAPSTQTGASILVSLPAAVLLHLLSCSHSYFQSSISFVINVFNVSVFSLMSDCEVLSISFFKNLSLEVQLFKILFKNKKGKIAKKNK